MSITLENGGDACESGAFQSDTKLKIYNYNFSSPSSPYIKTFSYYLTQEDRNNDDICSYLKKKFNAKVVTIQDYTGGGIDEYICNNISINSYIKNNKPDEAIQIYGSTTQQECENIKDINLCNKADKCSWRGRDRPRSPADPPCVIKEDCVGYGKDPLRPNHYYYGSSGQCKQYSKCNFNNTNKTCQYNQTHTVVSDDKCWDFIKTKCNLPKGFDYKEYICNKDGLDKCGSALQIGDKIEYNCNKCNTPSPSPSPN